MFWTSSSSSSVRSIVVLYFGFLLGHLTPFSSECSRLTPTVGSACSLLTLTSPSAFCSKYESAERKRYRKLPYPVAPSECFQQSPLSCGEIVIIGNGCGCWCLLFFWLWGTFNNEQALEHLCKITLIRKALKRIVQA